ncbi:MAG: hypothetical protein ACHQUC_09735 [Chlamydiales bacterium]
MAHAEMLWKRHQNKIDGQSKPFIDKNLQIQVPGLDLPSEARISSSCNPIYSHYCQGSFFITPEMASIETELDTAMLEAKHSYEAWKKMQKQLLEASMTSDLN